MKRNIPFWGGIAWLVVTFIWAMSDIGTMPKCDKPYEWYMPLQILTIFGGIFFMGILAGKDWKE